MIAKGNLHANGRKLADYLIKGNDQERAELAELRGFVYDNIHEAFEDIELQSANTDCEKPFFHGYVRLPKGEQLSREQWLETADRMEKELGFEGQPRAVAVHYLEGGETHLHVGWSRIDTENMRAIDPGLYKNKLKELSRELEIEFGLTRVSSERAPEHNTLAAGEKEFEEARRLKTDIREIREAIRDCWDHSDNGKSFIAALEQEGLRLARGDKRDFVVIDQEGGHHALSKRITGATAQQTRERLAEIDRAQLPTVEEARAQQLDRQIAVAEREGTAEQSATRSEPEQASPAPTEKPIGRTAGEVHLAYSLSESARGFIEALEERGLRLAQISAQDVADNARQREGYQQYVRDHPREAEMYGIKEPVRVWENELVVVALHRDEPRLCFLNERATGENRAEVEKYLATLNQADLPDLKAAAQQIRDAATVEREAGKYQEMELGKSAGEIRLAYTLSHTPQDFVDGLEERGLRFVEIAKRDVEQNQYEREFCAERGLRPPRELEEGQLCAVDRYGSVLLLNMHTTGESEKEVRRYMTPEVNLELPGAGAAYEEMFRAKYRIHDPELDQKQIHELREMRSELQQERRELKAQLAGDELLNEILPTERAAMQERAAEIKDRLADVGITIKEMCLAEPILARSEFTPFRSTEAREMSLEGSTEGLAKGAVSAGRELMDFAVGFADFAVRLVTEVLDWFFADSPPTREQAQARRELREEKREAEIDWKRYVTDSDYHDRVKAERERLESRQEAERGTYKQGRIDRGLDYD